MTPQDFCYWLQGAFEMGADDEGEGFTAAQVRTVKHHLSLVFAHIDDPDPDGLLNSLHETGEPAHMVPGKLIPNWHIMKQTCSVCKTDWYECKHGKDEPRPRC